MTRLPAKPLAGHRLEIETSFVRGDVRASCQCSWVSDTFQDTAAALTSARQHIALHRLLLSGYTPTDRQLP